MAVLGRNKPAQGERDVCICQGGVCVLDNFVALFGHNRGATHSAIRPRCTCSDSAAVTAPRTSPDRASRDTSSSTTGDDAPPPG